MSHGRSDTFAHPPISRGVGRCKPPFQGAKNTIVLARELAIGFHTLTLGDMQIPVFVKLPINTLDQAAEQREANGA